MFSIKEKKMNFFCKCFGHKWPDAISVLEAMAAIEVKNKLPCETIIKCKRRGCNAERNLNNELKKNQRANNEAV
jgi:hypothetical protein